jgi:hypothetical protein
MPVGIVDVDLLEAIWPESGAIGNGNGKLSQSGQDFVNVGDFESEVMTARNSFDSAITPSGVPGKLVGQRGMDHKSTGREPGSREIKIRSYRFRHAKLGDVKSLVASKSATISVIWSQAET